MRKLALLMAAIIWGIAFVAQSVGMEYVGPFTFSAVRCVLGSAILLPVIAVLGNARDHGAAVSREDKKTEWKHLLIGGSACGLLLFIAVNLQQFGILYAAVGKSGFITAMYIVLVPVMSIFFGKRTGIKTWIAVLLAVIGLYLLCVTQQSAFNKGDIYLILCAVAFAGQILVVDHYVVLVDGVKLSCVQFAVCAVFSTIAMLLTEQPSWDAILLAKVPILYAGFMSCGVAYTLQIVGQKNTDPTIASLLMSMESVVSVLAGWAILHQQLSVRELLGCVVMFAAIILAQLPQKEKETVQ